MVKEYRRAGADQEEPSPSDLRTPLALNRAMHHLIYNIIDDPRSTQLNLVLDWYDFLWDRLRAIRKDITQQNICDLNSTLLVEKCALFHIHACYAMNSIKDFEMGLNRKNLNDCLQMLRQMYTDLKNQGISCPNEVEFIKYDILLHLDEDHLSTNILLKTTEHRSSDQIKFTVQIFRAYINNDYYSFFKLMKQADYLTSCILSLFVNKMRTWAIRMIANSCRSNPETHYPAEQMIEALAFDDLEDLEGFLEPFNVSLTSCDTKFFVVLSKNCIKPSIKSKVFTYKRLVQDKVSNRRVGEIIDQRNELRDQVIPQLIPQSFPHSVIQEQQQQQQPVIQQVEQKPASQYRFVAPNYVQQQQKLLQQQQHIRQLQQQQQQQHQELLHQQQLRQIQLDQQQQQQQQSFQLQQRQQHQEQLQQQQQQHQEQLRAQHLNPYQHKQHQQKQQQLEQQQYSPQPSLKQPQQADRQEQSQQPQQQLQNQLPRQQIHEQGHQSPNKQKDQQKQQLSPQHLKEKQQLLEHPSVQKLPEQPKQHGYHEEQQVQREQDQQQQICQLLDREGQSQEHQDEHEQLARHLRVRSKQEIADLMPAGYLIKRTIKRKITKSPTIQAKYVIDTRHMSPIKRILLSHINNQNIE